MRLFLDTNVLIDVLAKRDGFYKDSLDVLRYCETRNADGFISAVTVTDLMYVLRKHVAKERLRETVKTMLLVVSVADITRSDISNAFESDMDDYEDAVQSCCAKRINADMIITRNVRDFQNSPVKALTPSEFLASINN